MRVSFWGVRGSLPSPQLPDQIKSKISAIIDKITVEDIKSPESRKAFLDDLPPWLFGTVGGNTPCLSIEPDNKNGDIIIFDGGSGIRDLGINLENRELKKRELHVFFTHFHWDHLMGLPFFNQAYDPEYTINYYSPKEELEKILRGQMQHPYFPISMDVMGLKRHFHKLKGEIKFSNFKISFKKMNHPGDSYAYKIDDGKSRCIFSTDAELSANDFLKNEENTEFFENADLLIMDSQYTLGEAIEKYNWGHSAFSLAVDFASNWNVKHMVLFHHDPGYDDRKLYNNLQSAKWYIDRMNIKNLKLSLAIEGMEIII